MTTIQLTLNVEDGIAEKLKAYTQRQHTDLNKLVEHLLGEVADEQQKLELAQAQRSTKTLKDYPEWLQKLVLSKEPTPDFDHKKEYGKHLEEKYGL
ncbi:DUF6364 family protein [Mucilaginibacter daejeonensis]|uniref:DUF6364 family protein n=1 Tax=Mucilaginibacter daejeonensis TaxID=398049 RepID=UPI001D176377|nr:DUF6364 family protein [Mucilaginibacter daejeonensis]UEG53669.1 DUF6364 family protein [Mucilaginibacter daejeonensis]